MPTIFVQIASYRDRELDLTVSDLISQSANPADLRIGVCRQYHQDDQFGTLEDYRNDSRFRIIDVEHHKSQGVCWARNKVQQLYSGEDYTLQIDSHMRFAHNWDSALIEMIDALKDSGYKKPLLTGYVPSYDPENDKESRVNEPWRTYFDRFLPQGAVVFRPEVIPDWEQLSLPIAARFYSAHFCFTTGDFCTEVQHNPNFYFHGEEISISARAFTHGYDLFHPHKVVLWHYYTRTSNVKQWDDDSKWHERNIRSHYLNRQLFNMEGNHDPYCNEPYGMGKNRTLADYEEYSGILFRSRMVQQYTLDKNNPPNPPYDSYGSIDELRSTYQSIFKYCINIDKKSLFESDYEFWAIAFHDEQGNTLFREDANSSEVISLLEGSSTHTELWRSFETRIYPDYWVVWPYSKSKGWCDQIRGDVNYI